MWRRASSPFARAHRCSARDPRRGCRGPAPASPPRPAAPPPHYRHHAEVLLAEDQQFAAIRRLAVQTLIDLAIGSAQAYANHLDRDLIRLELRIRHIAHVDGILLTGLNDDGFHPGLSNC